MKIKIFTDSNLSTLEKSVNEFLDQNDLIKTIQFTTSLKDADEMVPGLDARLFYSVMILYIEAKG